MSQHRLDTLQRHAGSLLLLMALVLMPWGRSAELPVLLAALLGLRELPRLKLDPETRPLLVAFLAYWLPELMSAPDAVEPVKAWTEVFADLRFLPLLLFAHAQLRSAPTLRRVLGCSAAVLAVWLLDALLQASTGFSLGGSNLTDRLSGIFGDDNLKLGGVLATLSPLLLWQARNLGGRKWLLGAALLCLWVVLLAGARAAWLVYGLVLIAMLWRELGGGRRALIGMGVAAVLGLSSGLAMWQLSPRFAERVDRTTAALQGDTAALDHALSFRLPIWRTALCLIEQHPWNGVGVRGFRHAYPDCAAADDRFLDRTQDIGALHAHQWVLEVLSETGMLGLSCWCIGIGWLARWHHRRDPQQRTDVFPVSVALLVLMFPLNTHYALYSSFHGLLLFWLLALWLAPTSTAQTT